MNEPREPNALGIPYGVEVAVAWAWRLLLLAAAVLGAVWVLRYFSEITVPLAVALLATALTIGAVDRLVRWGLPRLAATFAVVLTLLAVFLGLLTLVGQQASSQFDDLRADVVRGIDELQDWVRTGPLDLSDSQLQDYIDRAKQTISRSDGFFVSTAEHVGTTLGHVVAGFFVALFATFFFLYDGKRIWHWIVLLFPRASRPRVDSSGGVAWRSLTAFVRATVLVAFVDAVGISLSAFLLGVPLALAIGVLVFLGAFVPIVGALVSGLVAVVVALVTQGPWTALFMLIAVVAVQQLEAHVLQPFVMGRLVSVHPLAVILAIAAGITVGGIVGALVAVPLAACANGVVRHLAEGTGARFAADGLPADEQNPPVEPL